VIDDRDEPLRPDRTLWSKLVPFLAGDRGLYVTAIVLAPISAAMVLLQPWLLKVAIDRYITPGDLDGVRTAAVWYLGAVILGFVAETGHTLSLSVAAMRTITRVRRAVYAHTLGFAQRVFDQVPTGRLLTRATSDVDALGETLTAGAITIVLDALQVVGILVAMAILDLRLTATLLLVGPPLALVIEVLRRRLRKLYVLVRNTLSDLNAYLSERLDGVTVVQLYRDEARTLARFGDLLGRYRDANVRTNVYDALLYATVDGVTSVTLALMLWHGSGGILQGTVTAGVLAAFIDYVQKLFRPIQEFSAKIAILQRAGTSLSKIFGLLDHDERIRAGDRDPGGLRGEIRLEHVGFAYRDGTPVLQDVSLALNPGEVVALVGRTGSGKTTIGRLLTRQYDGFTGRITVDGVPIEELALPALRRGVGSVQQDVQLFPGDVRFNLTLGREVPDARVLEAVRLAHAEAVVARLGGLDGAIEEAGRNVSGGEAQLLSFARTLVHDPVVVILDEATASVDSLTEARLQAATEALLARKTTLVIAHRLSTIVHADRIVLLDQGRVVEVGRHEELLARGGAYATLFHQQLEQPEAAPASA
jgi:ATP-binding cassette subfamily B protein